MTMFKKIPNFVFVLCMGLIMTTAAWIVSLPVGIQSAAAATTFSNVSLNTTTPAKFAKFEIDFDLSATYTNPFNPDEVDVRAYFTTPSGAIEVVPGFYKSNSSPKWAIRYSPRQAGAHSVYIKVTDSSGTGQSATYTFTAGNAGDTRGFMGVSGSRMTDSYGKQLTLLGSNYAWAEPSEILNAMPQYQASKMNLMRVWQSVWWGNYALEWGPVSTTQSGITMEYNGIGKYQLENSARMDTLMDTAAANNIYIMLTLNSFGDMYYDWPQNAYNTANGGPSSWVDNDTNFWTNATAISYQKKLLRYNFARWGYSTGLGMLEYWNELDNHVMTWDHTLRDSWHTTMDTYWKSLDFYHHPTTTSFAWADQVGFNQYSWEGLTSLDVVNFHLYDDTPGAVDKWELNLKHSLTDFGNRPVFIAEYGRNGFENIADPQTVRYVHDGLWSPLFRAGAAGGNLIWCFDYKDTAVSGFNVPPNYKNMYTALANFMQPEEYYLPAMPFIDYGAQSNSTKVGAFKNSDRVLLWINDTRATYNVESPAAVTGMAFTIPSVNNGIYDISYTNTVTGATISTTTATASGGNLTLSSIPTFTRDIAVKAIRQGSSAADTTAPTAPSNLASPAKTDTTIDLTWKGATDAIGVASYNVYRGATLISSGSGFLKFTDSGLTANTAYSYTVKAKDAAGNLSGASNTLNISTNPIDVTAPTAPTNLISPAKSDNTITLSWTASTDNVGVTGYDIYRGTSLIGSTDGLTVTFMDSGLAASTAYSYNVKAKDARNNISTASNSLNVTTFAAAANFLQNPGFETDDGAGRPASWTCEQNWYCFRDTTVKHSGTSSLKVSGASAAWFAATQDISGSAGNTYTLDGYMNITANTGTTIDVAVQFLDAAKNVLSAQTAATNSSTTSGWVNVHGAYVAPTSTTSVRVYLHFATLNTTVYFDDFSLTKSTGTPDTQAPTAPTGLTSPSKTDTTVSLSWTASTDNVGVTGYDIYRGAVLAGSTTGATTFNVTGLTASTLYSFTVKAKDAAGNISAASSQLSVTTNAASLSNLLLNPGFETDNGSGVPASWTCEQSYCIRDTAVKRSGTASMKVDNVTGAWFGLYQNVSGTAGNTYTLDGYLNITRNTGTIIDVVVKFLNSSGTSISELTVATYNGSTTSGWVNVHGAYLAPTGTVSVQARVQFTNLNAAAYMDDFSLTSSAAADTQAPTAPTSLSSPAKTDTTVNLSWTASTDNVGVTGYDIYRGTTLAGSTTGATTFTATGLTASTAYSFTVKAKDAAGNISAASTALNVTTNATPTNLLLNPGFETDNGSGVPASWTCEQNYCSRDTAVKRSGTSSMKVDNVTGAWFGLYQNAAGSAARTYTVDGYLNITRNTGTTIDVVIKFINSSSTVISEQTVTTYNGTTTSGWANVHGAYLAPTGTANVQVRVQFTNLNAAVNLDDFSLISS